MYKHSPLAHLVLLGLSATFGLLAIAMRIAPHIHATPAMRDASGFVLGLASMIILGLYLTSGVNRYEVTEKGLRIHRLFHFTFYPWNDVFEIVWKPRLHLVAVYTEDHRIFYSSTDCFPDLNEFLRAIHERSRCRFSSNLENVLTQSS